MGRLLTVFNKFVLLGLILIQSLVLNTFVMLLTSLSAKNLVHTYWLRRIPEVFIISGTYHFLKEYIFESIYMFETFMDSNLQCAFQSLSDMHHTIQYGVNCLAGHNLYDCK